MKAIETINLTKSYGKSRGIIDVNLSVDEGDFFGFIGPNGAGKSTTIRTLLGLISPNNGNAEVLGYSIKTERNKILSEVGYLPSEAVFYSGMKVGDLISYSAKLRGIDCSKEAKYLCERLELDISKKISQLSLGNRKKVGIVCALQHRPKLLILDEPTSGLDPLMQREFYSLLQERNDEGTTIFLSSHILSEISKYCKNIAIIREGKILACDSVEKLAHTGVKRVNLTGVKEIIHIENAKDLQFENGNLNFLYDGTSKDLLSLLNGLEFDDFNVSNPDLDEVFMHYYE